MVDMSQLQQSIPPEALAAIQQRQGGMNGADVGMILQQLMEMSPEEVAQVLGQMGINVTPDQVHSAAENWVDQAAGKQAAGGAASNEAEAEAGEDAPDPETPGDTYEEEEGTDYTAPNFDTGEPEPYTPGQDNEEQAEARAGETPQQEADEGDEAALPPNAQPTGYSPAGGAGGANPAAALAALQGGGGAMPRGAGPTGPSVPGGPMDDLVSASMMQSAVGNPNAPVPISPRSPIPNPRSTGSPNKPRMAATIADLYRSTGGKGGRKPAAPSGKPSRSYPR